MVEFEAHGSIDNSKQESHAARRLGSRLNLLPPGGGIFAGRRVTALAVADRRLSLRQAPRRFAGWRLVRSAHPPRSIYSLAGTWRARNILRARQMPASSARVKHHAW